MSSSSIKTTLRSMNYNVKLVFLFSILQSFGRGIWMGSVLSNYIVIIAEISENSYGFTPNELLGLTSGATGLTLTLFVFPSGYIADKIGRDTVLRTAAIVGVASLLVILIYDTIPAIFVTLFLWGLFQALTRPSLESILADSIESGTRSRIFSWLHFARQVAQASGPITTIFLFLIFGNEWQISILKQVMTIGILASFLSLIVMVFFKDKRSLGEESEEILEETVKIQESKELSAVYADISYSKTAKLIPILLVSSSIIIGMGAGMTVKFFPIFLKDIYGLTPIDVQLILGLTSVFTGVSGIISQQFSLERGRVQLIFITQLSATLCLVALIFYPPVWLLYFLFIARGSLMNASEPLSRSILMDVIPKRHRGKLNAIKTISFGLFWNISAVLGGFLIGDDNFSLAFMVTAIIYFIGISPLIYLMPIVGKEKIAQIKDSIQEETKTEETENIVREELD